MTDTRPVWLTREQRDLLYEIHGTGWDLRFVIKAWDAAPADPTEAIAAWFAGHFPGALDNKDLDEFADAVLRALGMPDA